MKTKCLFSFFICMAIFLLGFAGIPHEVDQDDSILYVEGRGYPPIKSENLGQARLMARRAAVLDAYRNVLVLLGNEKDQRSDDVELAVAYGYVRGAQVIDEFFLSDGGVKVRLAYPLSEEEMARLGKKGSTQRMAVVLSEPKVVDLETWVRKLNEQREKAVQELKGLKTRSTPVVTGPLQTKGIHPVTLEEWHSIVQGMRR